MRGRNPQLRSVPGLTLSISFATTLLLSCTMPAPIGSSAGTAPSPSLNPLTQPAAASGEKKEVTLVRWARIPVANTVEALQKGNIAAAKSAWAPYDPIWNGVEVYVNFRSVPTYQDLETNWQAKITTALEDAQPKAADILPMAQAMLAKYDEAIKLSQTGPVISPLFDDLADLRLARQPLRAVAPLLTANNVVGAKSAFGEFPPFWPKVSGLVKARSNDVFNEVNQAIDAANAAFAKAQPTAAELTPLVAAVTNRVNFGISLVNSAARRADPAKTSVADADLRAASGVRSIQTTLKASLASWNAGQFADAGSKANQAVGPQLNDDAVASPLKAKSLDAALKAPLDAYTAVAGAAGDAAKVSAANKAAIEAGEVAIQGLVGQFWSDAKVQSALT